MPRVPARRVGQAREHEMDDVVGQVVLAIGDEDLLAEDAVGAVARPLGAGAQRAEVGARLRLGEVHRARPLAARRALRDRSPSARPSHARRAPRSRPWVSSGPRPKRHGGATFHISAQADD